MGEPHQATIRGQGIVALFWNFEHYFRAAPWVFPLLAAFAVFAGLSDLLILGGGVWFSPKMTDTSIRVDNLPLRGETWLEDDLLKNTSKKQYYLYSNRISRFLRSPGIWRIATGNYATQVGSG